METDRVLADAFLAHHPAEAAREIERHPLPAIGAFLCDCSPDDLARVVSAMDPAAAAAALEAIDLDHAVGIAAALSSPAASVLLRRVGANRRDAVLERMPPRAAARIRPRLRYPSGSAGALLDPGVLTAAPDQTVAEARERLQRADARSQSCLFVVDADGVLHGVVGFGELLTAARGARLDAIARRRFEAIRATADGQTLLTHPAWHDLHTPPVVDAAGRLLGVMRHAALHALAAESGRSAGPPLAATALALGELAWLAGIDIAGEMASALTPTPASRGREPFER